LTETKSKPSLRMSIWKWASGIIAVPANMLRA